MKPNCTDLVYTQSCNEFKQQFEVKVSSVRNRIFCNKKPWNSTTDLYSLIKIKNGSFYPLLKFLLANEALQTKQLKRKQF